MHLKIVYKNEKHMMMMTNAISIEEFKEKINQLFHHLPPNYSLEYSDVDGDRISISNDHDLEYLIKADFNKM
jgi:hypothetical protein